MVVVPLVERISVKSIDLLRTLPGGSPSRWLKQSLLRGASSRYLMPSAYPI